MKRKVMLCVLVFALLLTCASAMAAKISNANAESASGAEITEQADQSFKVTYTGQKDKEYVVMVVSEDGVGDGHVPTKESIGNNQNGVVVYMDQTKGNSEGKVEFVVRPNLETYKKGAKYFVYMSSNETSGNTMKQVGSFTATASLLGDVNSDDDVDDLDEMVLARYNAGWEDYGPGKTYNLDLDSADVNDDGEVDDLDEMILARHNAGWENYATLPHKD